MKGTVTVKVGFFNVGDEVEVVAYDSQFGILGNMFQVKNLTQNWTHYIDKHNVNWENKIF